MAVSSQTKTIIAVAVLLIFVYLVQRGYHTGSSSTHEEESTILPENIDTDKDDRMEGFAGTEMTGEADSQAGSTASTESGQSGQSPYLATGVNAGENGDTNVEQKYKNVPLDREAMVKYFPQKDFAPPESSWMASKFNGRNKSKGGYKKVSYSGANRGNLGPSDWEDYFDHNNNVIGNSETGDNDKFLPVDETKGGFAVFKTKGRATCGSNQNCEPEDLFDVDKYLPQEVNDDWFEVQPEPISVKNRHLINITKPIGINTIGTSLKNASYDIRASPAAPKFVVSPWLQSSIEPDLNLKPLF